MYYRTTGDIHLNLLKITFANGLMWCNVFHLFVGRNKKRKPVIEGHFRLNMNIEGHMNDLYCLF